MTPARTRTREAYFNVPASRQPLRVRAPERHPRAALEFHIDPLEQLVVGDPFDPLDGGAPFPEIDAAGAKDAAYECAHGRLPGDRTPPCGCWAQEPEPVPDLIPDWVLGDARDLLAAGMSCRKIARAILTVTACEDVPSCEKLLKLTLLGVQVSRR